MPNYTRIAIIQTFQDMLHELPFEKITVSAIVARCGISSNTFYYHFRDIYDLLNAWLQQIKEKYFYSTDLPWRECLKCVLRDMQNNPSLIYHLFYSLPRERIEEYIFSAKDNIFYEIVCKEVGDAPISEEALQILAEYHSYAMLGYFLKFIWNRMEADVDEGIDHFYQIFSLNIQWAIQACKK